MSNYTIEVTENVVNLDVLKDHDVIIEIKSSDNFITFDTPSGYPILFTSGTLPVSRVGSGYLIENLTSGNTIVRTFGNQLVSGIKTFNDNVIISGYLSTRSEASNIGASHFPVFISDPSTFSRSVFTRTLSQVKSDLGLNNVQDVALSGVNFFAGSGLVGGGNLSSSRSFDIGQGDGLIVSADSISLDPTVVRTTGNQIIIGQKAFTSPAIFNSGTFTSLRVGVTGVSLSGHIHIVSDVTGLQAALDSKQPSGNYVTGSHTHTSSSITDFNTSVDSRIINANLQPSGNYSSVGHTHAISDIISLQTALDGKQASGNYATSSHTHTSSNITDFNTSVSGLVNGIYAPLNSPSFSGVPLTPTATAGTNSTQIASTAFVRTEISNLVASAPLALDTLNELATALGNDANFSTTVTNNLAGKANLSGATFTGSVSGPSGNFTSLKVNNVDVSANGHTHTASNITDFNTSVDSRITNANLQPSGNYSVVGHTHTSSNITDFNSSVSGLVNVKNITAGNYINVSSTTGNYTLAVTGLQPSGNYSLIGHSHTVSDITNFNSAVSGLLPISGIIAGYDILVTNNSGIYTIASSNLVHVDSKQPQGFINRTDSRISVSGNIFRIEPTGSSYSYYNQGIKVIKTSGDSLTIPNLTQINYIHFDTINNQLSNKTTSFDFSSDIPIAYVAWNSGVGPSGQMTFFAEERHGIVMDTSTHKWIHNTFGAQYVDGLSIGSYVLGGNGSNNSHATISIGNGTLYQEDIEINITDSSSTDPFCQELSPIAQIPVYYHEGSTGQWVKNAATNYPVKYGANGPQYNSFGGGTWTIPDVSPGGQTRYFAVWILATNQIDDPIISIMGQRIDGNQGSAENNNLWSDVNLTNLPISEVKPLYRLIFAGDRDYTNVPKCSLHSILDIRVSVISTIAGVSQNDHGSLFGLGDDDHSQYLHVDNARTVNAVHDFVNGLNVNGTGVSISGHTHTASNITNFNSSVSGLLPVGTTNYLSKFGTGGSGLSNSLVFDNGTNVGIGTTTPSGQLHVIGTGIFSSGLSVGANTTTVNATTYNSLFNGNICVGSGDAVRTISIFGNNSTKSMILKSHGGNSYVTYGVGSQNLGLGDSDVGGNAFLNINHYAGSTPGSGTGHKFHTKSPGFGGYYDVIINSSGWMGIGSGIIPQAALHVIGTGIFSSGIGVGINTPLDLIHVSGSSANAQGIRIDNGDGQGGSIQADNGALYFKSSTATAFRVQAAKIRLGDGATSTAIELTSNGSISQDGNGGGLTFSGTTAQFSNGINVTNSGIFGSVGIGTTTPSKKLDVIGDARVSGVLNLVNTSDSTDRSIAVTSNNMTFAGVHGIFEYSVGLRGSRGSACGLESNATNGYLALAAGGSEKVRIATDGKVGIGTTTPSSQLHVIGSGVISSGLIVNGNLTFDSFTESVVAIGNSSTSKTIDLTSGTVQTCTLTGNCTFTMPTATAGKSFTLFLNSGAGNYTATFTGVRWADSAIPTATIIASKVDIYSFISDGTYWYGSFSQNYG